MRTLRGDGGTQFISNLICKVQGICKVIYFCIIFGNCKVLQGCNIYGMVRLFVDKEE